MLPSSAFLQFPDTCVAQFKMIDVGRKRPTWRMAVASGSIVLGAEAYAALKAGTLPKGNVLALAEAAAIMAAKNTPNTIPLCHTLPLDQATVHFELQDDDQAVIAYCQVRAHAKTGVEMEALCGTQAALLTLWDLTKGVDPNLSIHTVRLLVKSGGKSGLWINPAGIPDWLRQQLPQNELAGTSAAVLVMSDRASRGTYADESGAFLRTALAAAGADVVGYEVVPDEMTTIAASLRQIIRAHQPDILLASGGTGPGPRDVTPDVLVALCDKMLDGLGDLLRQESQHITETAWLSRMTAGMKDGTLIIALPGSLKAVRECWDILRPFIGTALSRIKQQS